MQPSICTYNRKVYRSTNTTTYSFVLTGLSPEPAPFEIPSPIENDAYHATDLQAIKTPLLARIQVLKTRVNDRFYFVQHRYKRNYNTKVCSIFKFRPSQMIYLDKALIAATLAGNAERLATTCKTKLISKVMGRFAIVSVQPHTLTINEHGLQNMV